jgi:hypothetical protein
MVVVQVSASAENYIAVRHACATYYRQCVSPRVCPSLSGLLSTGHIRTLTRPTHTPTSNITIQVPVFFFFFDFFMYI